MPSCAPLVLTSLLGGVRVRTQLCIVFGYDVSPPGHTSASILIALTCPSHCHCHGHFIRSRCPHRQAGTRPLSGRTLAAKGVHIDPSPCQPHILCTGEPLGVLLEKNSGRTRSGDRPAAHSIPVYRHHCDRHLHRRRFWDYPHKLTERAFSVFANL